MAQAWRDVLSIKTQEKYQQDTDRNCRDHIYSIVHIGLNALRGWKASVARQNRIDFSVIIPSYNRANLISRALDSILMQSYPACEIIVVDDGSSDGTARLLYENFPEVRHVYQRHAGVSAARNHGIRTAKSQWIALLDSDDAWLPEKLSLQATAICDNPMVRLIHTNESWFRNGKQIQQKKHHQKFGGMIFERCLPLCVISPSSAVIRRDVFADIGQFNESLKACEDYDFWLRYCAREPVVFLDRPLVQKFGGHADQLSRRIHALDRYRIRSLQMLLESGVLDAHQQLQASATLLNKLRIYNTGAVKRGRLQEAAAYASLAATLRRIAQD